MRLFLLVVSAQLVVGASIPSLRPGLVYHFREDGPVEGLSAVLFLAAALVAGWRLWRRSESRALWGLCAVAGLIGFLDELSFGERLFSLSMPTILGIKIDAVHDLVAVAARILRRAGREVALAWLLGVVAIFAWSGWRYRDRLSGWARRVKESPPRRAFVVFVGLIAVAIGLDVLPILGVEPPLEVAIVEELLELNAAVCLLLVCLPRSTR